MERALCRPVTLRPRLSVGFALLVRHCGLQAARVVLARQFVTQEPCYGRVRAHSHARVFRSTSKRSADVDYGYTVPLDVCDVPIAAQGHPTWIVGSTRRGASCYDISD